MIEWCILIYCLFSFFVMHEVQPQNDKNPVLSVILCFIIGGSIFIIAAIWGIFRLIFPVPGDKE